MIMAGEGVPQLLLSTAAVLAPRGLRGMLTHACAIMRMHSVSILLSAIHIKL